MNCAFHANSKISPNKLYRRHPRLTPTLLAITMFPIRMESDRTKKRASYARNLSRTDHARTRENASSRMGHMSYEKTRSWTQSTRQRSVTFSWMRGTAFTGRGATSFTTRSFRGREKWSLTWSSLGWGPKRIRGWCRFYNNEFLHWYFLVLWTINKSKIYVLFISWFYLKIKWN